MSVYDEPLLCEHCKLNLGADPDGICAEPGCEQFTVPEHCIDCHPFIVDD